MKVIVQDGDPILRSTAKNVPESWFGTKKLSQIVSDLTETLEEEPDGVALAAPQIGIPYRIFIARIDRTLPPPLKGEPPHPVELQIYVNPEIVKMSRKKHEVDEGCLSVRGMYGKTKRHERVTIKARKEDGARFTRGAGGILAQIFEHETDHLNGVLFIDHAKDLIRIRHPHGEDA
jgi:peptide deformylase